MPTRPHTLVPTSGHPVWQRSSKTPEFPKSPLAWLDCGEEPTHEQILEALAFAMTRSGKDVWDLGDDVMPPAIPSAVMEWLKVAPPWPAYRPARGVRIQPDPRWRRMADSTEANPGHLGAVSRIPLFAARGSFGSGRQGFDKAFERYHDGIEPAAMA